MPKKGEMFEVSDPSANTKAWPKDRARGKATGDSSFVLWSQVEGKLSNIIVQFLPQDSAEGFKLIVLPLLQSYPGKCPYSNKAAADSTAFINRSIVNLFISFTCQLS